MSNSNEAQLVSCCPPNEIDQVCDSLDFHYRLTHFARVEAPNPAGGVTVPVEVKMNFRLTRCRGPLAIGDLVYTTTLLPGEKVRLFTSDRRSRFTFDTSTKFGYRNTQSSEESFFMQQMSNSLFDVSSRDETNSSNQSHAHVDGHADAGVDIFGLGGSANMSGNFDANSTSTFLGEHSQHAESAFHAAQMGTRKANSISIGESQSRTHTESESQDHYESASREFTNPNKCHAITFLFYQINKTQTVKYTLESIERRVILDPQNDFTKVAGNPLGPSTGVGVASQHVLSTDPNRKATYLEAVTRVEGTGVGGVGLRSAFTQIPVDIRTQALQQVDAELVKEGLLDKVGGNVSPEAQKRYSFEKQSSLPTAGVLVKGCLDDCDICEPTLTQEIELDLENKKLQNALLQRQIDLLDKAQEYRCCPDDDHDDDKSSE